MNKVKSLEDFKHKFTTTIEAPVAWGEMDSFKHVNNIFYFRYFESVRMHYLTQIGAIAYFEQNNIGPILAATDCKFIFPMTWPDKVVIGTRIDNENVGEDRFEMSYGVWSQKHSKIAALGSSVIVYYDYNLLSKTNIPEEIRMRILEA